MNIPKPIAPSVPKAEIWRRLLKDTTKDDCWIRNTSIKGGYTSIRLDGVYYLAHRLVYWLHNDVDPSELHVMHRCDTPRCINPEHLTLGTHQQNVADAKSKGRHTHGEKIGTAKLTEDDVRAIRNTSGTNQAVAEQYGVHASSVSAIRNGKAWAHIK